MSDSRPPKHRHYARRHCGICGGLRAVRTRMMTDQPRRCRRWTAEPGEDIRTGTIVVRGRLDEVSDGVWGYDMHGPWHPLPEDLPRPRPPTWLPAPVTSVPPEPERK